MSLPHSAVDNTFFYVPLFFSSTMARRTKECSTSSEQAQKNERSKHWKRSGKYTGPAMTTDVYRRNKEGHWAPELFVVRGQALTLLGWKNDQKMITIKQKGQSHVTSNLLLPCVCCLGGMAKSMRKEGIRHSNWRICQRPWHRLH